MKTIKSGKYEEPKPEVWWVGRTISCEKCYGVFEMEKADNVVTSGPFVGVRHRAETRCPTPKCGNVIWFYQDQVSPRARIIQRYLSSLLVLHGQVDDLVVDRVQDTLATVWGTEVKALSASAELSVELVKAFWDEVTSVHKSLGKAVAYWGEVSNPPDLHSLSPFDNVEIRLTPSNNLETRVLAINAKRGLESLKGK